MVDPFGISVSHSSGSGLGIKSETVRALDTRWRAACRILFKSDLGGLEDYAPWLIQNIEPISQKQSGISSKEVISAPTEYCANSEWISFDEVDFNKKFKPLGINEIKDIDSLTNALSERFYYTGNIFFGQCSNIERSSNINDSFFIYNTGRFGNSKYLAYCTIGRQNEDCFGCNAISESAMCIRCNRSHRNKRCFETWMSQNCSDTYLSYGLNGCSNCLFSFNLKSRRYAVGNLILDPSKYQQVKDKLVAEMAEQLIAKKQLPSLIDFANMADFRKPDISCACTEQTGLGGKEKFEAAFSSTTNILFGKPLHGLDSYSEWLGRHTRKVEKCASAVCGKTQYIATYANYPKLPKNRLVSEGEAQAIAQCTSLTAGEIEGLSLDTVGAKIGKLAFFNIGLSEGVNFNLVDCAVSIDSSDCYKSSVTEYSKNCAFSFWPRNCQYLFGCDSPFDSSFSINCYSCTNQTRCFEIDCCGYCSDLYFGHNCENVHNSMFCFNVKNRRNCIGNAEYPPDQYKQIKSSLLTQISDELERKRDLKWDIYNIGRRASR